MLSGIRMLISGLIIFVLNWRFYVHGGFEKFKIHWKSFLAITVFTNFLPTLLKAYGNKNLLSSKAAFLGSIDPFVTAFYAYLLYSESLTLKKWVGIVLGLVGTLLFLSTSPQFESSFSTFLMISWPELAILASVAISRLGWILVQKHMRTNVFSAVDINGVVMTGGGLLAFLSIPLWRALGLSNEVFSWKAIGAAFSGSIVVKGVTVPMIYLMGYTVIIGNLFAYNLYAHLLKHNSATLMSLAGLTFPIFVSLLGYFVLNETVTYMLVLAAVFMLAGVAVFYYDDLVRDLAKRKKLEEPTI